MHSILNSLDNYLLSSEKKKQPPKPTAVMANFCRLKLRPSVPGVAFGFAVDAAAVLLPVEAHFFRKLHAALKARAEIHIQKGYAVGGGDGLAGLLQYVMFLIRADQEGGCKGIELAVLGNACRLLKAHLVA